MKRGKAYKLNKDCFCNYHCSYDCPNASCSELEERYGIPCEDAGLERVKCKDCYLNTYLCVDCLFLNSDDCPRNADLIRMEGIMYDAL